MKMQKIYHLAVAAVVGLALSSCSLLGGGGKDTPTKQRTTNNPPPSLKQGLHSKDFCMKDKELTMLTAAKAMLCLMIELLYDGAAEGKRVKEGFKPVLTKEQYLREWGRLE